MSIEKFHVHAVRSITSPSDDKTNTYYLWVEFRDLPVDFSLEVNPRKPKMTTAVAKQLIKAVVSTDDLSFDLNNRGIVITAKSFKHDTSSSAVILDMGDDKDRYGILDGGHTYTAIIQNRHKLPDEIKKYVRVEVIIGEHLDVAGLSDARNTSAQVSDIALFELEDKFNFIKDVIVREPFANKVAYKDNDNKDIPVIELIRAMFMFNIKRYPDDISVPVQAYSGKTMMFKDYKNECEEVDNIYKKLAKILPDLLDLYEKIAVELPDKYKKFKIMTGKMAKFGAVKGVNGCAGGILFKMPYYGSECQYQIPTGFILPIFGAFRSLLKFNKNGELYWEFDPTDVWDKAGVQLVQNTFDTNGNPQLAGKSKILWQSNYRIVDGVRKDMLLEKLQHLQNI